MKSPCPSVRWAVADGSRGSKVAQDFLQKIGLFVLKWQNSFQRGKLACDWTEKTADGKVPSFRVLIGAGSEFHVS